MEPTRSSTSEKPADEKQLDPRVEDEPGLRFEDPYWDDAFCAWWDPTLRTCC